MENNHCVILESSYTSMPEIVKDGVDVTIFKTVLQESDAKNRNNRIYTNRALREALNRQMVQEKLKNKTFFGECGHPLEETVERQTYINQRNISHIITDIWWEGNLLYGLVETANTAAGRDFQGLIRQGSKVSFSMRGVGGKYGTNQNGSKVVDGGLYIIAYDWVKNFIYF